ncbi:MAG: hypothetical protein E7572_08705 [Ruminococcaceae bacterium]|nr:hypothetical protein [Oscillospiraceae bacterium]
MPTAFCVASDAMAVGALQAFNEKGWKIPERGGQKVWCFQKYKYIRS